MELTHQDIIKFLIIIGVVLIGSRLFSEGIKRFGLPSVLGEILFGIILGPTVFGAFFPDAFDALFPFINNPSPENHNLDISLKIITEFSIILLLFVAGLEVQLPVVIKQGKIALTTTLFSMILPIAIGFGACMAFPELFGLSPEDDPTLVGFFIGVILSITALPVIARILMDLGIFKTSIGMTIIASAMLVDLLGWIVFSILMTLIDPNAGGSIWQTIGFVLGFGILALTVGTKLINKVLPWVQSKFAWPGGVLSLSIGFALLGAAFTEGIGIHSILGSFIVGIALGDATNLKEETSEIVHQFINNIFAPIFFTSIGLYIDFTAHFSLSILIVLLILAYFSKILGASLGAKIGGLNWRKSFIVGMGMNTHGVLEIILGTIALNNQLINQEFFVSIVLMVIISIITSAPLMKLTQGKEVLT